MLALTHADTKPAAVLALALVIGAVLSLTHADSKPAVRVNLALVITGAALALTHVITGAALALMHTDTKPAAGLALALVIGAVLAFTHADSLPAFCIVRAAHRLGQRRVTLGLGCRCELRAQHRHAVDGRASERGRWRGC